MSWLKIKQAKEKVNIKKQLYSYFFSQSYMNGKKTPNYFSKLGRLYNGESWNKADSSPSFPAACMNKNETAVNFSINQRNEARFGNIHHGRGRKEDTRSSILKRQRKKNNNGIGLFASFHCFCHFLFCFLVLCSVIHKHRGTLRVQVLLKKKK